MKFIVGFINLFVLYISLGSCQADDLSVKLYDSDGKYISAHGGGIYKLDGLYFWYGENRYSDNNSGVSMYQSADLHNWKSLGVVFHDSDIKINSESYFLERPKIIFNNETHKFIMWFHVESKQGNYKSALAGVAISDYIQGPYKFISASRINKNKSPVNGNYIGSELANKVNRDQSSQGQMSRDIFVFKDDSNTAYLVSSSEENLTLTISKLTSDYLHTTGKYIRIAPGGYNEAPVMFKNGKDYFIVSSATTGWKPNRARLFTARKIFGYWKRSGEFNQSVNYLDNNTTFNSQGSNVFVYKKSLYFMADKWNPRNLSSSGYLFKKINFSVSGSPFIK